MKVISLAITEAYTGAHCATVVGRNYGQACSRAAEYLNRQEGQRAPSKQLPVAKLTLESLREMMSRDCIWLRLHAQEHTL